MRTAKPQSAGSGPNSGPGRKRYFVNIVTQDQILEFQNEVSSQNTVPLLAPGKRENRLLILAPNMETIDSFQKRVLTQFQYNANVSADAVKLLESHFCEVPRSYSVSDALDARAETYLVVENIRELGLKSKRKLSESPASSPSSEVSTTKGEPSAKRLRRREKQAVKLASPEAEDDATLQAPELSGHAKKQATLDLAKESSGGSLPEPTEQNASAHKPLFGRSRAENERRPSTSFKAKPDGTPIKAASSGTGNVEESQESAEKLVPETPPHSDQKSEESNDKKLDSSHVVASQETPKPKRGRPPKANTAITPVKPAADPAPKVPAKTNSKPTTKTEAAEVSKPNGGAKGGQIDKKESQVEAISGTSQKSEAVVPAEKKVGIAPSNKKSNSTSESDRLRNEAASGSLKDTASGLQQTTKQTEDVAESETDSSGSDDSESSGSESDSGERQRRLSRRRVVAVPNDKPSEPEALPTKSETAKKVSSGSSSSAKSKPSPGKPAASSQQHEVAAHDGHALKPKAENVQNSKSEAQNDAGHANVGPQRIPGLGSLADLANMRLPTVHEQNHKTASTPSKPFAEEESSEEEEDDSSEEDSSDSNDSDGDSSDEDDTSTAGRKNRKRGLLGLLGKK